MSLHCKKTFNKGGFTLIEVIVVLIILGILAAVAVSHVLSTNNELTPQADIVKSHLRYAQLKALNDDINTWSVVFGANSYSLTTTAAGGPGLLPSEDSSSHQFPNGVTITNPQTVTYNSLGSPGTADIPIILSQGGSTRTITIAGNTGFITP